MEKQDEKKAITLTNEELYEFRENAKLIKFKENWGFTKTLFNNLKKVNDGIKIVEVYRPKKEDIAGYTAFKKDLDSLSEKFIDDQDSLDKEIEKLRYKKDHKKFFEVLDSQVKLFNDTLKKDSEISLDQFDDESVLEKSKIDGNLLYGIRFMLLNLK